MISKTPSMFTRSPPARPGTIAPFRIEGIRVTHSLMDCLALGRRDAGRHGDPHRRFQDRQHADGRRDVRLPAVCRLRREGRAALLSDSTNVERARPHAVGAGSRHQPRTDHPVEHRQSLGLDLFFEHPANPAGRRYFRALRPACRAERPEHDSQQPSRRRARLPAICRAAP